MTSCEPSRCSAYSEDLRWRIIWQTQALQYTSEQVANNVGTENRISARWLNFGTLKKAYTKNESRMKLTAPAQLLVLHLVIVNPGMFLREIQREIQDTLELARLRWG